MGRRVFLKKMAAEAAATAWNEALREWTVEGEETLATTAALGRVTSRAVFATCNAPAFASAAMDGIAVRAASTFGATERTPVTLSPNEYAEINTGNALPPEYDAVIMVEETNESPQGMVIHHAVPPWHHVRQIGENAVAGSMLLPTGSEVTPAAAALLLSAGVLDVCLRRRPRIAIIPTGDELTTPTAPEEGKVPETNSTLIAGTLAEWGAEPTVWPIVGDDREAIATALDEAVRQYDLVILNAGSSAGSKDYAADVVQSLGTLVVHGVEVRPGKPLLLGVVQDKPVAGLPGYPVAALVDLDRFVKPLVDRATRRPVGQKRMITARAATTIASKLGDEEYIHGKLVEVAQQRLLHPLPRGSASLTSAVRADGVAVIPAHVEGVREGEELTVHLRSTAPALTRSLIAVGSHDLLLDLIADELRNLASPLHLDSLHVGSMGGIRAMARRNTHLAGIHLLDDRSGTYNEPFLDKYLTDVPYALVHLCKRQQGLLVARGNPLAIDGLDCLTRDGLRYVNRQQGSGTRVLLDIELQRRGISSQEIRGYSREETTHIAVAIRVANGGADCGLAIKAAAQALNLDFVPVEEERYDLLMEGTFFDSAQGHALRSLLQSATFRRRAEAFGGYDCSRAGTVLRG